MFRRQLRPEAGAPSLRFRPPSVHIPLWILAVGWLIATAAAGAWWLARHPRTLGLLALAVATVVLDVTAWLAVLAVLTSGLLCLWWALSPPSFEAWCAAPARTRAREYVVYRREWQPAMLTAGLTLRDSWGGDLPTLRSVRAEAGGDVVRVRMLPGQTVEQWQAAAPKLAQTFGHRMMRVRRVPGRPQEVELFVRRRNGVLRNVTEPAVDTDTGELPAVRPAFPRQPRGGAA